MGIKGWIAGGVGVLTLIAVWLGVKKKEDEHYEKIQRLIRDVDRKEVKEKTVDEIVNDVNEAIKGMDIDGDEEIVKPVLEVNKGIKIVDNAIELEMARQRKEDEAKLNELKEKMNDPEWVAEQERLKKEQEEKKEADWRRKVKKAVEQKNFSRLEDLFDEKYAGGPWHPSPASVFGDAVKDGVIDDVFYHMASEHFGKLWCYSGD